MAGYSINEAIAEETMNKCRADPECWDAVLKQLEKEDQQEAARIAHEQSIKENSYFEYIVYKIWQFIKVAMVAAGFGLLYMLLFMFCLHLTTLGRKNN